MLASVLKKTHILLFALLSMALIGIGASTPASAAPVSLDDRINMFLYYRGVNDCLNNIDLGKRSATEIGAGDYWSGGFLVGDDIDRRFSAALLTGSDEFRGPVCRKDDDDYFPDAAAAFGFDSPINMYCAMQPVANREKEGSGANEYEKCLNGSGYYDASGSAKDQSTQFTTGIKKYAANGASVPIDPANEMRYRIYLKTFEAFCDPERVSNYKADRDKALADSKDYVVINEVKLTKEGARYAYDVVPALYKVGIDDGQDHKVFGVWATPNSGSYDLSCGQLASKTWDFDEDYGKYLVANPEEADGSLASGSVDSEEVCSAGALGWVICPAINFIGEMNDIIYGMVEKLLYTNPAAVETGGPLYDTWAKFRDVANILFVGIFLAVIFSQATSIGLSSYGIKRMLPRILMAAVLVNISFFITQIAIDLSNIVGVGTTDLVNSMRSGVKADDYDMSWASAIALGLTGGGLIAGGLAVAGAGSVAAAMAMILPFAVTALFAVITAFVVLIARQAIIIILVALAPLAFIAMVLPNTQKYFQMWQNTFTLMLLMFPLVAFLFAGSQLAANIILTSSSSGEGIPFFMVVVAVAIMFLPLFGVPYIVKFSGGLMGRIAGVVNNPNKGPFDSLRRKAEEQRDYKRNQAQIRNASGEYGSGVSGFVRKNTFGRKSRRDARYAAIKQSVKREADEAASGYVAEEAVNNARFGKQMAGGEAYQGANMQTALNRVQAQGIAMQRKESRERIASIQQRFQHDNLDLDGLEAKYAQAAAIGDYETMTAAINESSKQGAGGRDMTAKMISTYGIQGSKDQTAEQVRGEMARSIYELNLPARTDIAKGGMGANGTWDLKDVSKLSTEHKASLDGDVLQAAISNNKITQAEAERIVTTNLRDKVENANLVKQLENIAYPGGAPPTGPSPAGGGTPPTTPPTGGSSGGGTPPPTPPTGGSGSSGGGTI